MLNSKNIKEKQIGTVMYFIDNLALRVGNEKSADIADTVGVTNLRIEHIQLLENNTIKLNFLGKDSIKYVNKVQVLPIIYSNLEYSFQPKLVFKTRNNLYRNKVEKIRVYLSDIYINVKFRLVRW